MYKFNLAILALLSLCLVSCEQNELDNQDKANSELSTRSFEPISINFTNDQLSTHTITGDLAEIDYLDSVWSNLTITTEDGSLSYVAKKVSIASVSGNTLTAINQDGQQHLATTIDIDACGTALCLDAHNGVLQGTVFIVEDMAEGF